MKPEELIKCINDFTEKYPTMKENDIIFYTSHGRIRKEGFYHRQEFRGIGLNSLLNKDCLTIHLDK